MRKFTLALPAKVHGVLWIVLGMSLFTFINAIFKQFGAELPLASVMFLRAAVILLMIAPWALRQRAAAIRTRKPSLHLGRMLFTSASAACAIYAVGRLPLAEVTMYSLTTCIWLFPLGLIFLGEKVRPMRWVGVAVGFVGVWMVAQPTVSGLSLAVLAAIGGALADAFLGVLLKRGANSESLLAVIWWTYLGQTLVFGAMAGFALPDLALMQWLGIALLSAVSIACMGCFKRGYQLADASLAETGCFSGLAVGPLLGWLMFGELLGANYWLGALLLTGGILIALFEPGLAQLRRFAWVR